MADDDPIPAYVLAPGKEHFPQRQRIIVDVAVLESRKYVPHAVGFATRGAFKAVIAPAPFEQPPAIVLAAPAPVQ